MDQPLLFLIKLAWASRYRLPILITVGFMALDIRMQLEIHIQMRRVRRGPPHPLRGGRYQYEPHEGADRNRNNSDDSSGSWLTMDEDELESDSFESSEDMAGENSVNTAPYTISRENLQLHNSLDVNLEN